MSTSAPGVIKNHAAFIWSVADLLRGDYKQSEYGKVDPAAHRDPPAGLRAGADQARCSPSTSS